ncbi:MAG TPA: nitrous oxide reductase accessory protein NosL [Candidatus Competibacteraceae bacterium]|nr:nitrous oxide reductase accessory protein NosL [Candidatus Competibacteraceae bacterium]
MMTRRYFLFGCGGFALLGLTGCERPETAGAALQPVPIEADDACALCGMPISEFPGPKGELILQGASQVLKFCSTRDLFAYMLQPDIAPSIRAIYVHDMAATAWDKPATEAFVDARQAWYVAGHPLPGAMGPTLASFKERPAAEAFSQRHRGRLLSFQQVDLALLQNLGEGMPAMAPAPMPGHAGH